MSNSSSHSPAPIDATDKALALEQAFAEAPFPVALWSSAVLRFRWLNRACVALADGDPTSWDVLGMPYRGFLSEASCASHLIDVAYTGQPSVDPWYARGGGGDERVWRLTYLPVPAHLGDPADVLLTAVEITQSAHAELVERRKRDDLYKASSLISATILSSLDAEEILERVLAEATSALDADWGWLAERASGSWVFRAVHGWPVDMVGTAFNDDEISLPGLAARQRTVVHASVGGCSAEHRALMERHGIGAFALVPVQNRGEVTAVLGFCWDGTYAFGDAARSLTRSLAVSLPLALENARLYEEEQSLTRSLRFALLPDPAGLPGFEVGHLYHAVSRTVPIGGGFYDLVPLAGGRAGVIMGDVRGSGPEIAALTSAVRSTMRSAVHRLPAPASVLARTNEFACTVSDRGLATTAFMGLISPDGRLEYSVAGHPPPIVLRSTGSIEQLLGDSAGLGSRVSAGFTVRENRLGHGDLMVLYTEGLTGVSDRQGRRFGTERLMDAVEACAGMAAHDVPESLFMSAFSHGEGRIDSEIAILALRRCAAA